MFQDPKNQNVCVWSFHCFSSAQTTHSGFQRYLISENIFQETKWPSSLKAVTTKILKHTVLLLLNATSELPLEVYWTLNKLLEALSI